MTQFLRLSALVTSGCAVLVTGCSSATSAPPHVAVAQAAPGSASAATVRPALRTARRALPSLQDGDSDCVFLENAALAVEQYQAFIQRAGAAPEFATALERSRNQVSDLQAEMDFVRSGIAQRGARCGSS